MSQTLILNKTIMDTKEVKFQKLTGEVPPVATDFPELREAVIKYAFTGTILHCSCMKVYLYNKVLQSSVLPFTDITVTEISDTEDDVTISMQEFGTIRFRFYFERSKYSEHNFLLKKVV